MMLWLRCRKITPLRTGGLGSPSTAKIFLQDISRLIPMKLLDLLYDHFPSASLNTMRTNRDITHKFAQDLLDHKSDSIARGKNSRDVMSILGKFSKGRLGSFFSIPAFHSLSLLNHSAIFFSHLQTLDMLESLVLVRANTSENEKTRLSDFEMISQMRYVISSSFLFFFQPHLIFQSYQSPIYPIT